MKKRIIFFLPDLYGGGAERVLLMIADKLSEKGMAITLVLGRARGSLLQEVPAQVEVVDLSRSMPSLAIAGFAFSTFLRLTYFLYQQRPDILLSSLTGANLVAILARKIGSSSTHLIIREANTLLNISSFIKKKLINVLYPMVDCFIAVSNGIKEDLESSLTIEPEKIYVIYNPIDYLKIETLANEPLHHPWFHDQTNKIIISVGRLEPQKDFATLIQAFNLVKQDVPNIKLLILGEGSLRQDLEALVQKLGLDECVDMPGFISNPFPYMKNAALFVLSSRWEGMPNALIQAVALNIPVVSTDCHSGPREILTDRNAGKLVLIGNVAVMAQSIQEQLKAIKNLKDGFDQRFEIENIVDSYYKVLIADS